MSRRPTTYIQFLVIQSENEKNFKCRHPFQIVHASVTVLLQWIHILSPSRQLFVAQLLSPGLSIGLYAESETNETSILHFQCLKQARAKRLAYRSFSQRRTQMQRRDIVLREVFSVLVKIHKY